MKDCLGQELEIGDFIVKPQDGIVGIIIGFHPNEQRLKFINVSYLQLEFKGNSHSQFIVKITEEQMTSYCHRRAPLYPGDLEQHILMVQQKILNE